MLPGSVYRSLQGFISTLEEIPDDADTVLELYLDCKWRQGTEKSSFFYDIVNLNQDEAIPIIEDMLMNN